MKLKNTLQVVLLSTAFLTTVTLSSCGEKNDISSFVNEKVTLTIEYVSGSAILKTEEKEIEKDKIFNLNSLSYDNYKFIGFYSDESLTTEISSITPTNDTKIYAKFEPVESKELNSFISNTNFDFTFTIDLSNYTKTDKTENYDISKTSTLFSFDANDKLNNESHTSSFSNAQSKKIEDQEVQIDSSELTVYTTMSNENTNIEFNFIYSFDTESISIVYNTTNTVVSTSYKYDLAFNFYEIKAHLGSSENIYTLNSTTQTYKRGTIHSDTKSSSITATSTLSPSSLIIFEDNDQIKFSFKLSTNIEL